MNATQSTASINVIEATELIYDHLFADESLTLGQLYEANTFMMFISMLYEAGMAKVHPKELVTKKPGRYREVLELVMDCVSGLEVYQEEKLSVLQLCNELILSCASALSVCPSRLHLRPL